MKSSYFNWTGFSQAYILWSLMKQNWNGAHYEICVNCYDSHKVHMIPKSFAVTPIQNVWYLSFILSGYIFGNKDQLCTLANRAFAKLKTSFKQLETLDMILPKLQGAFANLTKLCSFWLHQEQGCFFTLLLLQYCHHLKYPCARRHCNIN